MTIKIHFEILKISGSIGNLFFPDTTGSSAIINKIILKIYQTYGCFEG